MGVVVEEVNGMPMMAFFEAHGKRIVIGPAQE